MIKAPQITYLDYKANGDHYDVAFSKVVIAFFAD